MTWNKIKKLLFKEVEINVKQSDIFTLKPTAACPINSVQKKFEIQI